MRKDHLSTLGVFVPLLEPGDYGKDKDGLWWARVPTEVDEKWFPQASLANHHVQEHEDGTITVSPSILMECNGRQWHGYLIKGVWSKA